MAVHFTQTLSTVQVPPPKRTAWKNYFFSAPKNRSFTVIIIVTIQSRTSDKRHNKKGGFKLTSPKGQNSWSKCAIILRFHGIHTVYCAHSLYLVITCHWLQRWRSGVTRPLCPWPHHRGLNTLEDRLPSQPPITSLYDLLHLQWVSRVYTLNGMWRYFINLLENATKTETL